MLQFKYCLKMVKVKKISLPNNSTDSTTVSKSLPLSLDTTSKSISKKKKFSKTKLKKSPLSNGYKKIRKIFTDKKTGKQHIKYDTDNKATVYVEHIPHGFYEEQIKDFFKQFGEVTAVNVPRSKSGNAKGYGFVQFRHPEVAKIAAEAMNNYLMFNRLIKTKYIPPEQQKSYLFRKAESAIFKQKTAKDVAQMRKKQDVKRKSKYLDSNDEEQFQMKMRKKLNALKKRCADIGVEFYCQVAGASSEEVVQLLSAKKVSESPQPEDKSKNKKNAEANVKTQKKISKNSSPKHDKKSAQKQLKVKKAESVPAKVKASKKIVKSPKLVKKTAQKPLKAILEIIPSKKKTKPSKEIPSKVGKVKKSATKCLKKIGKEAPSVPKKKIDKITKLVEKKLPKRLRKQN